MAAVEGRYGGRMFLSEQENLPKPEPETMSALMDLAREEMQRLYNEKKAGKEEVEIDGVNYKLHKKEIVSLATEHALKKIVIDSEKAGIDYGSFKNGVALRPLYFGAVWNELSQEISKYFMNHSESDNMISEDTFSYHELSESKEPMQIELKYPEKKTSSPPNSKLPTRPSSMPSDFTVYEDPDDEKED